jgi:hypothetical protein
MDIQEEHPELGFGLYTLHFKRGGTSDRYLEIDPETHRVGGFMAGDNAQLILQGYNLLKRYDFSKAFGDLSPADLRKLSLAAAHNPKIVTNDAIAQRTLDDLVNKDPTVEKAISDVDSYLKTGYMSLESAKLANQRGIHDALKEDNEAGALALLYRAPGIEAIKEIYNKGVTKKIINPQV